MTSVAQDRRVAPRAVRARDERQDNKVERVVLGTAAVVAILVVWELLTVLKVKPPIILPGPADVITAFRHMFSTSTIWTDLAASGEELLYGFLLATVVGIPAGLIIGWYRRIGYIFDPLVNFLYAIPRIALSPLLIIWLGIGLSSRLALVFLLAVFPILINTTSAIRNLDPQVLRAARCFGASDLQIFRTVALPGSVPFLLSGMRIAVGQALIGVFVAELLGAQHGIGELMNTAGQQFQTATVFAGLIIFAAAGFLLTALVRRAERHFDAWRL